MKAKAIIAIVLLGILALPSVACGGGASPESTVKEFMDEAADLDIVDLLALCVPEARDSIRSDIEALMMGGQTPSFSDVRIGVISKLEDTAIVTSWKRDYSSRLYPFD